MGRHRKKIVHPEESMERLIHWAAELFEKPYDDRDGREEGLPSVRYVAEEMDTTVLRVRKLLISAGYYSTEISRSVQELFQKGLPVDKIMEKKELGRASVYSYLPYRGLAFNLDQTTVNADRLKLYRRRRKCVGEFLEHLDKPDAEDYLWKAITAFENYPLHTVKGLKFTYVVSRGRGGMSGEEILIDREEITITRAVANMVFHKLREIQMKEGSVSGPDRISGFGAESDYMYPLLLRFGMITLIPDHRQ